MSLPFLSLNKMLKMITQILIFFSQYYFNGNNNDDMLLWLIESCTKRKSSVTIHVGLSIPKAQVYKSHENE